MTMPGVAQLEGAYARLQMTLSELKAWDAKLKAEG